jgi:hypothetical protein
MKKVTYINTLPYTFDKKHPIAHYLLEDGVYRNHGEICESIVKHHLGLFTTVNKNTSWNNGSDIETLRSSVKSRGACIGRNFNGIHDPNKQLTYYFKNVASSNFIWVIWNEKTGEVVEFWMNKREFGAFVREFTYYARDSKMKDLAIRFRQDTKKMRNWLEVRCA